MGMRVLYSFPHRLGAPGIGTTALQQVLGLIRRGHDVTVIATSVDPRHRPQAPVICTMVVGGARVPHRVLGQDRTLAYHDRRVAAHLRKSSEYDVVHCWPGAALRTSQVSRNLGVPCLREVPNTHTANAMAVVSRLCEQLGIDPPKGHSHTMNVRRLRHEEAEYSEASGLLTPSDQVRATFLERGYPPAKLLRHQYGFDPQVFSPRPGDRSGPLRALFLGTVEPRKGLHVALEAWRRSRAYEHAEFVVCGAILDAYRPSLGDNLSLPNVQLKGFVKDTAAVLQSADILVLPSFEEGSALVTYEAQGCGVVPVVSDAAGAPCVDGVTGLIHRAGDVETLARQFAFLAEDPSRLTKLREAVLAGRRELTWDAAAARLEACYRAAMSATAELPLPAEAVTRSR